MNVFVLILVGWALLIVLTCWWVAHYSPFRDEDEELYEERWRP